MSSNVHVSFEHPQAYWPWSHSSGGFHMADHHGIHMPNYYYYQQQQQQHLRQQHQHQAVDHSGGGGGGGYNTTTSTAPTAYHILHHRDSISEKEHLFEKPLTPSDVGKLNRLVIPKQHAEKHFPLDGDSGEKGLLLSFEDETGKSWRFRYSYWTSSQSYVLTKGWSRFVKEKRLDAGDVVLFQRKRSDADHMYIGCKRRGDTAGGPSTNNNGAAATAALPSPWTSTTQVLYGTPHQSTAAAPSYMCIDHNNSSASQHHRGEAAPAARYQSQSQNGSNASSTTATNSKRLRLFGVNLDLECSIGSSESSSSPSAETLQLEQQGQFSVPTHGSQRELQFLPCIDGPSTYL